MLEVEELVVLLCVEVLLIQQLQGLVFYNYLFLLRFRFYVVFNDIVV